VRSCRLRRLPSTKREMGRGNMKGNVMLTSPSFVSWADISMLPFPCVVFCNSVDGKGNEHATIAAMVGYKGRTPQR